MLTDSRQERWLDVLAGRQAPADAAERQAAELRGYFEQQAAAVPAMDAEQHKRLMNTLRARGAFTPAAPAAQPRSLLSALRDWWQAPQGRMGYGYGAAALLAFALVSVPLLQQPQDDDDQGMGGQPMQVPPPPVKAPGTSKSVPMATAPGGTTVASPDPGEAALRWQLLLSGQGVASALQRDGTGWLLTADLPAASRDALGPQLQADGLAWPADGRLKLRFVKQPS